MNTSSRRLFALLLAAALLLGFLFGCGAQNAPFDAPAAPSVAAPSSVATPPPVSSEQHSDEQTPLDEDGFYYSDEDVALYIHLYGRLPENYLNKQQAAELGWVSSEGNLWDVAQGMCIGGDVFRNREGLLPEQSGRIWRECDVNYEGGYRTGERLVFSNDGLIYYSQDHYASFTLLYEP